MPDTEGLSFLEPLHGRDRLPPAYAVSHSSNGKRAIRVGKWKLTVRASKGWTGLYDLTASAPEAKDLRRRAPLAGRLCEIHLSEALAAPRKLDRGGDGARRQRYEARDLELDSETRSQLEALGYL